MSNIAWNVNDLFITDNALDGDIYSGNCRIYNSSGVEQDFLYEFNQNNGFFRCPRLNIDNTKLYIINYINNLVHIYDVNIPHDLLTTIDLSTYFVGNPTCITFNVSGGYFIGSIAGDYSSTILQFDSSNNYITSYNVSGSLISSIALHSNQTTIYYVTQDTSVKKYDIITGDFPDITNSLPGTYARNIEILPNNELLIADNEYIVKLNDSGTILQTYSASGIVDSYSWIDTCLDSTKNYFWGLVYGPSNYIYKFNLATGNIEIGEVLIPGIVSGITTSTPISSDGNINYITNISVILNPDDTITLKWKDNSLTETGYLVERKLLTDTDYITIGVVTNPSETGFVTLTDTTVDILNNKYQYKISIIG